jgi:hypothetical protein
MRKTVRIVLCGGALLMLGAAARAQSGTGAIEVFARISPTGGKPEPVRQFSLYVLTKSYAEIVKEVGGQDPLPTREKFIENLKCSPELKAWLKSHEVMDLTSPDLDQLLTPDEIMKVPEFLAAYERANSGGVTRGLPKPGYRETDKDSNPAKYKKLRDEFLAATRKFIETNPATVQGMELELSGVNPQVPWDRLQADHRQRIARLGPDTAQVKYLAGKTETDLDGRALITGLAPGSYWVSSLGMDAASGDRRLVWDVGVKVQAGQTAHLELSNLNGTDFRGSAAP